MAPDFTHVPRNRKLVWEFRTSVVALAYGATLWGCSGEVVYPLPQDSNGPNAASNPAGGGSSGVTPAVNPPVVTPTAGAPSGGTSSVGMGGMPPDDSKPNDCEITSLQAMAILEKSCGSCHGPGTNIGSFDSVLDLEKLKASGKLKPGDADASPLYKRIASGQMPPAGPTPRPNPQEVGVVYDWIEECTAAPVGTPGTTPACGPRIEFTDMLSAMVTDISRIELRDRVFIRYFTLTHLYNAGICEKKELDVYRFGLAKAVNALSLGTQIVAPEAIDENETIYRIDLRDYEWEAAGSRADKWEILVAGNPFAVSFEEDDAEVLKSFAGTDVPFQAGDWFVHDGSQPPLYHDMVEIPTTFQALERTLGVNVQANIENRDVWRAGFLNSGVSEQNRVIERHELPVSNARTLWVSYDFGGNGDRQNIFSNPLDFRPDGSEVIFTLPNGMHAYMVADAAGTRLDVAPTNIVVDPNQPDKNVRNGISCISCHNDGMKMKEDDLRAYVAGSTDFSVAQKQLVEELYTPISEFEALIARDSRLWSESVRAVGASAGATTEPIIDVFARYEENVDLKRAAAELGIPPERLLRELGGLNPGLASLGFSSVKRDVFEDAFAETVCLLNLGETNDPACD